MSKKFISFVDEGLLNMTYTSRLQSYLEGNVVDVNPFDLFDVETPLAINSGYSKKDILNDFGLYTDMVHLKKSLYGIDYMYIGQHQELDLWKNFFVTLEKTRKISKDCWKCAQIIL